MKAHYYIDHLFRGVSKFVRLLAIAVLFLVSAGHNANSQAIQGGTGAPSQAFHVSNGPRTFTVTVFGGAISSASLKITLPTGYVVVVGSATGTGLTASMASSSGNIATINLAGIPASGTSASFTYSAYATCAAIGVAGNQADYVLTPTGGSALAAVQSNSFNLVNAKINLTNLVNSPTVAGIVGDNYTRTFRINNNGFGNIDTVYVTDISGIGVQHVSHSVSTTNNSASVDVLLVSSTTSGNNTTYLYRFIVSSTAQDDHLGQNEYFTFTQNLKIVSCTDLNTGLNGWYGTGPNAQPCVPQNDTQTTALAVDNGKQPNLTLTVNPSPSTLAAQSNSQLVCRGQPSDQFFMLKNTGGASAINVKLRLYHNSTVPGITAAKGDQVGFASNSFKYKIPGGSTTVDDDYVAIATTGTSGIHIENQNYYTQTSCINTAAPAWLDLVIPELAAGETIYITYQDVNCCDNDCIGRVVQPTVMTQQYFNACGTQIRNTIGGTGDILRNSASGTNAFFETFPTDMIAGDTYTLKWETTSSTYSSTLYPAGSTITYQITLPVGMVYDNSAITMHTKNGATATPTSVTYSGNVLNITFTTGQNNFTVADANNKAILSVPGISLDCSLSGGASSGAVSTKWIYKSVGCSCEEAVICHDQAIAFHCPGTCQTGLANNNFTVIRRTNGNPDNNNDGVADGSTLSSNVRTNWVSRGDLLDFTFTGAVADIGTTIHNFKYGYAKLTIPNSTKSEFTGVSATVKITNADGSVVKADLTNYPLTYTASSGVAMVDISADKLAAAGMSGYSQFVDTDKITVIITLKVTGGIGAYLTATTVSTDFYLSDAANADGANSSDKWACGGFSGAYTLVGISVLAGSPSTTNLAECATVNVSNGVNLLVGTGGLPGANYYVDEYRQMGLPSTYTFTMPAGYTVESMAFTLRRTTSNYNYVATTISNVAPDAISGQIYTYNLRKQFADQGGSWLLPDEGFTVVFSLVLRPTCEAVVSSRVDYEMTIVQGTQMTETFPTASFSPSSYVTLNLTKTNLVVNANAPIQTVTGNNVSWDVQIANTQPGTTPTVWMGENDGSTNGVTIQSVVPITGFGGTVSGAAITANTAGIYQLGNYVQESKYYRVVATFTNCGEDQLPLAVGYVCGSYPTSIAAASCQIINNLTVIPTDGALQVSLIGQPTPTYPDSPGSPTGTVDLCEELQYTTEVKNPAQGSAFDLMFAVQKPAGVAYIAGSYQLSHTILPATANLVAVNNDAAYVTETATSITFTIPADKVANLPYNDGYTIRYRVRTTACDFVSGTKMTLQALGKNGCGSSINGTQQQTQTIRIKGENLNPNSYIITSSITGDIQACAAPGAVTYSFSAVNNGPMSTYTGESIRIAVPNSYALGTITPGTNFSGFGAPTVTSDATTTTYVWIMPAGIGAGQTLAFTAPITLAAGTDAATLSCGTSDPIRELIAYTFEAACMPNPPGPVCTGNLQSEGENENTTITVVKPDFSITAVTATQPASGQVTGTLTVANSNPSATGVPQSVNLKIYRDTDNDGVVDTGEALIGTQVIDLTGASSEVINYSMSTTYTGDLCPAVVVVEPVCACSNSVTYWLNCDVVLPVTLKSFNVNSFENIVVLDWATTLETNSERFEIERSTDLQNWGKLGVVLAKGESTTQVAYQYTDKTPWPGVNYYRLKMVDRDGTFAYSRIRSITFISSTAFIYPNPVTDRLFFNTGELGKVASVEIINVQGATVISMKKPTLQTVMVDRLTPGVYVVKITFLSGSSWQQKIIKQ